MPVLWPTILRGADDLQLAMTRDSTTGDFYGERQFLPGPIGEQPQFPAPIS